jgi:DNA polymerase-3 subunit alpha
MIFDLVAKFASYGFNKSHAAAYAVVSYQTAYLKANFPVEFLAASMTLDLGNTDKLNEFRLEARRLGIEVVPPDINRSGVTFDVADSTILYALAALKGVGTQAVEHLVQVRGCKPFTDLADFAARIDPQMINRKALECLVQSGAFDSLEPHRAKVFENIGKIVAAAQERSERAASGISDLFGNGTEPTPLFLSEADSWAPSDRLQREFAAIGTYLSSHPVSDYEAVIKSRGGLTWNAFLDRLRSRGEFSGWSQPPWCNDRNGGRARADGSASSRYPTRPPSSRRPFIRSGWRTGAICLSRASHCLCNSAPNSMPTRKR